jgi:hypothetical protein
MPWAAIAAGAGSLAGGLLGADAAGAAADAQRRAQREAMNMGWAQYLASLGITEPWRATGANALNELNALFGYAQQPYQSATSIAGGYQNASQAANNRIGARAVLKLLKQGLSIDEIAGMGSLKTNSGVLKKLAKKGVSAEDIATLQAGPWGQMQSQGAPASPSSAGPTGLAVFQASPDYQFRVNEGQRDIGNSFAARGGAFSGNALKALTYFNQNMASNELQNFINRRMALAGFGQSTAENQGRSANYFGNVGGNYLSNMGDARASGIANQANMWGQAIGGAANAFGDWWANRNRTGGGSSGRGM